MIIIFISILIPIPIPIPITIVSDKGIVISDGLACFNAVTDAGCLHDKIVCGGGRASVEEAEFYRVNTSLVI